VAWLLLVLQLLLVLLLQGDAAGRERRHHP
jgi:hypothetical protein